ncbi:MAG: alpha/beta fold hydrolase [Caulobacteraceae bacterium]
MITRRQGLAAGLIAPIAAVGWPAFAAPTPPTIEALTRKRSLLDAAISPDGKRVAALHEQKDGTGRAAFIRILNADNIAADPKRVVLGDVDVEAIAWANDERLLVWVTHDRVERYTAGLNRLADIDKFHIRRAMTISADGSSIAMLLGDDRTAQKYNEDLGVVIDWMPSDPRHILMRVGDYRVGRWAIYKVDVYTGASDPFEIGDVRTVNWWSVDGHPFARWDMSDNGGSIFDLFVRPQGETSWTFARRVRRDELNKPDFDIVAATSEPNVMIAQAVGPSDRARVLRKFNIKTLQLGEVVSSRTDRDVMGAFADTGGRLVATAYVDDRVVYDFVDPGMEAPMRAVNGAFANEANVRLHDLDSRRQKLVLSASGPRVEGGYFLFNRETKKLDTLGFCKPWLPGTGLAKMEMLETAVPGGGTMRSYLSVPLADGQRPLVVVPHGGPESRDGYDYDLFAQALAAQGWYVLQPNFRGSDGYGRPYAESGRRHWGDLMQEDVEAVVAQVLASGRVNPAKVAIFGASYGGYAALMGGVRKPELYKAVVSIAGVSDLIEMMVREKRDSGENSASYAYWVSQLGDPRTQQDLLAAASPRRQAGRFAAPVLLIHGLDDTIVYPDQSKFMAQALKAAGKPYQHLEIPEVGHRNWKPEIQLKILQTAADFIGRAFA